MTTTRTTQTTAIHHRGISARAFAVAGAVAAVCGLGLAWAGPAGASPVSAVAIIALPGTTTPLTTGASTTPFTVSLPAQAACPGDTATGGYHVYSYMLQQGASLSGVTFINSPSAGLGLVDNTGTYYGPANTAIGTGQIVSIPNDFQWAPLVSGGGATLAQLLYSGSGSTASGAWDVGLVCANTSGVPVDNWAAPITFNASSTDPTGFTWTSIPAGSSAPTFTSTASTTFTVGTAGTFTVTATGSPTPAITKTGTLPAGVTFTGGVLSGTPTATGTFPITFTAANGITPNATQSFTLTVQAASTTTTSTTTTTTTNPTTTTTTSPTVVPADVDTGTPSGDDSGSTATGDGSTGSTGTDPTLAFTGFHTATGLGLGLLGVGLGLMLLGWGYRTKIRPRRARGSST